jgi:hypothetical protein
VARTIPGHRRHPRRRVEPQPVVTGSPARPDPVAPFEHNRSNACTAQGCRGCQPGRTRAADDRLRRGVIVIADAIHPSASGVQHQRFPPGRNLVVPRSKVRSQARRRYSILKFEVILKFEALLQISEPARKGVAMEGHDRANVELNDFM